MHASIKAKLRKDLELAWVELDTGRQQLAAWASLANVSSLGQSDQRVGGAGAVDSTLKDQDWDRMEDGRHLNDALVLKPH